MTDLNRRDFLKGLGAGSALAAGLLVGLPVRAAAAPRFELPALPWPEDALAPHISARTIGYHYGKHHRGYVEKTNKAIAGTAHEGKSLGEIMKATASDPSAKGIFNNAAQAWNHMFYWNSLNPATTVPGGKLAERIRMDFGGIDALKNELVSTAAGQFGSGWGWLVLDGRRLAVMKTSNADNPIVHGKTPLLTVDVWEHAYYLDYQNDRKSYLEAVVNRLLNWDFAERNLAGAAS